jgi:hypothetical protein
LPVIDDGDGDFGALGIVDIPDVASDAMAPTMDGIHCAERLVVVVVDPGEVAQLLRRQRLLAGQET